MSQNTKLWVDDSRSKPDASWDHAVSFHSAICMLETGVYTTLALDHDLGSIYGLREMTGYDIISWLEQRQRDGFFVPTDITCQSSNPEGKRAILVVAARIKAHDEKMQALIDGS
jgi:NAD+-processing family protein with receiver domain